MAITEVKDRLLSFVTSGHFGRPNGFGLIRFGWTVYGEDVEWAGNFQRRKLSKGRGVIKTPHMWPSNPQTETQQSWRAIFATGVSAWQSLTTVDKSKYNRRARPLQMSGFNLYMREWLNDNT